MDEQLTLFDDAGHRPQTQEDAVLASAVLRDNARHGNQPAAAHTRTVSIVVCSDSAGELLSELFRARTDNSFSAVDFIAVASGRQSSQSRASATRSIRRLTLPARAGTSLHLRAGFCAARGEYIVFVDKDCRLDLPTVASLVSALDQMPRAGMCGAVSLPDTPLRSFRVRLWEKVSGASRPPVLPAGGLPVPCIDAPVFALRREVAEAAGFPATFLGWQPTAADLSLRVARLGWTLLLLPAREQSSQFSRTRRSRPAAPGWYAIFCVLMSHRLYPFLSRGFDLLASLTVAILLLPAAGARLLAGKRPALPAPVTAIMLGRMRVVGVSPASASATELAGWTGLWCVSRECEKTSDEPRRQDVRWISRRGISLDARIALSTVAAAAREKACSVFRRKEAAGPSRTTAGRERLIRSARRR